MNPKQLEILKKKAFAAENITLRVEFEVINEEYRIGSFDVDLNKKLKTGLFFEGIRFLFMKSEFSCHFFKNCSLF